jgi:hypothetical protein
MPPEALAEVRRGQQQIDGAIESTVGMFGDFQGIAGQSLQEIEGLDVQRLGE